MNYLEIVGWVATFVVIGSFLINDMLKLRSVNLVGATLWLVYGVIAGSFSIMFLNIVVMSIQIFKIRQLLNNKS
ncbi:MAG: lactate dehydrogenase [Flavobacteriaceae bacterium]|nr:lactate dehydrogenase [Flavobacteriaceae bacterium]|tara:strand:+ start:539 stop:760 length:222 start_codon:yes stop_codon:yes gene_type:complete